MPRVDPSCENEDEDHHDGGDRVVPGCRNADTRRREVARAYSVRTHCADGQNQSYQKPPRHQPDDHAQRLWLAPRRRVVVPGGSLTT